MGLHLAPHWVPAAAQRLTQAIDPAIDPLRLLAPPSEGMCARLLPAPGSCISCEFQHAKGYDQP